MVEESPAPAAQITLGQAFQEYINSLKPERRSLDGMYVRKYVESAGDDTLASTLTAGRIESYAERDIRPSDPNAGERVAALKGWFQFLKKRGYTVQNYGIHIRVPKSGNSRAGRSAPRQRLEEAAIEMTQEGHDALAAELADLEQKAVEIRERIAVAREDKDFRENSPLDAAREELGFNEGRRKQIEGTLKRSVVVSGVEGENAAVGSSVTVTRLDTSRQETYRLVSAREANAAERKISTESPVGKALLGARAGDEVDVPAPSGVIRFRIDSVAHS